MKFPDIGYKCHSCVGRGTYPELAYKPQASPLTVAEYPRISYQLRTKYPRLWELYGTPEFIGSRPTFEGKAYRVDIENYGIPRDATAADIIRFERDELGNQMDVSDALLKELDRYSHRDVIWVTRLEKDAEVYLPEGYDKKDISVVDVGEGARILVEDGQGGYLVLKGGSKPKSEAAPKKPSYLKEVAETECQIISPQYYDILRWFAIPVPDYSFAIEPEVKERKIDEVLQRLKDGVARIHESAVFREFLITMSKFHQYSIGNQILIMIQRPVATKVAGFNTWKDLGRYVKKGESGISILAPCLPPRAEVSDRYVATSEGMQPGYWKVIDTTTGDTIRSGFTVKSVAEEEARRLNKGKEAAIPTYFKVVYVFDVSQTEGKPLPEFMVPVLSGAVSEELFATTLAHDRKQGLDVSFEPRPGQGPEIKGTYLGKSIWVRPEESRAQQLKTLLHETAHYYTESVFGIPRADAETIAESVAFVVGAHFGFDTGVRSFPYVALWAKEREMLERNLASVRRVAIGIIEGLEGGK